MHKYLIINEYQKDKGEVTNKQWRENGNVKLKNKTKKGSAHLKAPCDVRDLGYFNQVEKVLKYG